MTPAETARLLAFVEAVCPPEDEVELAAGAWQPVLDDLDAAEVQAATIRLLRRQCDLVPQEVRAEVQALRRRPPAVQPVRPDAAPSGPHAAQALDVPCPWCEAAPGRACTVAGSTVPLRKTPAHPVRLIVAGATRHDF